MGESVDRAMTQNKDNRDHDIVVDMESTVTDRQPECRLV
jgi:hypothetical protein